MASTNIELAAIKILLIDIYSMTAESKPSAAIAEQFIEDRRQGILSNLDSLRKNVSENQNKTIDEISAVISELLQGIKVKAGKRP